MAEDPPENANAQDWNRPLWELEEKRGGESHAAVVSRGLHCLVLTWTSSESPRLQIENCVKKVRFHL